MTGGLTIDGLESRVRESNARVFTAHRYLAGLWSLSNTLMRPDSFTSAFATFRE
jgi:hypothetical protein